MEIKCLQTKWDAALFEKGKDRVALIKSLIYERVWKRSFEGRAIKDLKEVFQKCKLMYVFHFFVLENLFFHFPTFSFDVETTSRTKFERIKKWEFFTIFLLFRVYFKSFLFWLKLRFTKLLLCREAFKRNE